jgi:molybdenum ABC transporter molybdate-binding protein
MKARNTVLLFVCLILLLSGCGAQPTAIPEPLSPTQMPTMEPAASGNLTVFAAASLTESFTELAQLFESQHPGVKVVPNFAGSQQLSTQLGAGAPADVFASANTTQMANAIQAGRVVDGSQQVFAYNRLVVIYPTDNPGGITRLQDLAKPGLKLILAAEEVPIGKYSLEFLDKASQDPAFGGTFKDDVLNNVVSYEQTVKAVLTKVVLGEGDGGIVYRTDVSQDNADKVGQIDIPDALNSIGTYPIAPIADAAQPELAAAFIELVLSPEGQGVLGKYGFTFEPPETAAATPAASGVTITDALQRTVSFAQLPQRIAIAGKAFFMIMDSVYLFPESTERLAILPEGSQTAAGSFASVVDPGYEGKAFLESQAGPEQIAPAKPDAVILKSLVAETLGAPLEMLGIPVVYVDLETPEQYARDLLIIGQVLGNEKHAQEILDYFQAKQDRVAERLQGLSPDDRPDVLLLQYSDKGGEVAFSVPPASWLQTTLVEQAGGNAVWKEASQGSGWTVVNLEQIAAWNPDKILIINYSGDVDETVESLKADARWQGLKAVQAGEIYAYPKDFYSWDQPDPRWILGFTWQATKINPDLFTDVDVMQEMYEFFDQLYRLDPAAVDQSIVPVLQGDLGR